MRTVALALLTSLTLATAAGAQEAAPVEAPAVEDPIGALLQDMPPDQTTDMDAEEPAPQALLAAPAAAPAAPIAPMVAAPPPVVIPYTPPPLMIPSPPRPALDRPVMIGETGLSPDGPPSDVDRDYAGRLRASSQSAQGLQGPLDGGWTVRAHDGTSLYALQLVDQGNYGSLEGAWRVLNGSGRVGLIDSLERQPTILTIRITRSYGKPPAVLTLTVNPDGSWTGDIADEAGTRPVTMRRS